MTDSNQTYILENSQKTAELAETIATTMSGNTFHRHFHILYSLRDLIDKPYATYCEIGTFNGGSFCLMMQNPKPMKLISIDPLHLSRTAKPILMENIQKFNKYNYDTVVTEKFSTDPNVIEYLKNTKTSIDILFIDGDHSFNAVVNDFKLYEQYVESGGFIVFDDYLDAQHSPQVRPAVDSIVQMIKHMNMPYEVIGSLPNIAKSHPASLSNLNEFVLRKK